jgi:hypothetical protein
MESNPTELNAADMAKAKECMQKEVAGTAAHKSK